MDFLEIRRKAKERAETRARATPVSPEPPPVEPPVLARRSTEDAATPDVDAAETVLAPLQPLPPALEPVRAAFAADEEPPPGPPDFSRLDSFEAVVQAVQAAGGELTPIPELPPWGDALSRVTLLDDAVGPGGEDEPRAPASAWPAETCEAVAPTHAPPLDPLDEFFYSDGESAPGLPPLAFGAPLVAPEPEVADVEREYLVFRLGDEEYAIDIERVREVLKAPAITDVPRAPVHVLGVIMVRGDVIAVFDPRRRLGLPEVDRAPSPRVLVCDDGLGPIGLLVDAVTQVVRLRRSDVEPRPQGIGEVSAEYISGIGRKAGRMFILLDLPVVLRGKVVERAEEAA